MVFCFEDTDHILALLGVAIASLAWLFTLRKCTFAWYQWVYAAVAALVVTTVLTINFPNVFPTGWVTSLGLMGGIFLVYLAMAGQALQLNMIGFTFLLLMPILQHNSQVVTHALQTNVHSGFSDLTGMIVFGVLVAVGLAILWYTGLTGIVMSVVASCVASLLVVVFVRLVIIEYHEPAIQDSEGNWSALQICCFGGEDAPRNRCPIDVGTGWNGLTLMGGILLVGVSMLCWANTCCSSTPEEKAKKKTEKKQKAERKGSDGKGKPKPVRLDEWDM